MIYNKLHILCCVLLLILFQKTHSQSSKHILDSVNNEIYSVKKNVNYNSFTKDTLQVNLLIYLINQLEEVEPEFTLQKAENALQLAKK